MKRIGWLAAALGLAGCRPGPAPLVEGEWALELTVEQPGNAPAARPGQRLAGTLVVDPRIPDTYTSGDRALSPGFTPGRIYLSRRPLYDTAAAAGAYAFHNGLQHDIFEEALARVDSAGRLHAWLTPSVTHTGIELRGTLAGDRVAGSWVHAGYLDEVGPSGTFVLRRVARTGLTDSALSRSQRARQAWDRRPR